MEATAKSDAADATSITQLCKWFEDFSSATETARRLAERDRDYRDNKQWTAEEEKALNERHQPVVTKNRIAPKVDFLLGTERKTRTDPRAFPREPGDEEAAEAATDALRFVADQNDFDQIKSAAFENLVVEGYGGGIVEYDNGDVVIRWIPWDRLFYDPHSYKRDFSDARYKGVIAWLDEDQLVELYGESAKAIYDGCVTWATSSTFDDKPKDAGVSWYDATRKRVMVVEIYWRERGRWRMSVFTKGGTLISARDSAYTDEDGEPICPIEMQSCYIDRDNNRYGVVRSYISAQDEINKRTSKALHLLSVRQFVYEDGALDDVKAAQKQLAKPDGAVKVNPGLRFELLDTNDMAQGNLAMLQEAKQEIDASGASAALQGRENEGASGRALQARQQGGLIELGPIFDSSRAWERAIYRQVWCRIRQFWTEQKWVRVTDDDEAPRYVGLNAPSTVGERLLKDAQKNGATPFDLERLRLQLQNDPAAQQPVIENEVARMDLDIIIAEQPDIVSLQGEALEPLAQLFSAAPDRVPFELIVEATPLPSAVKKRILEKMAPDPQAQQREQELQAQVEDLQKRLAAAELQNTEADTEQKRSAAALNLAKAETEQAKTASTDVQTMDSMLAPPPGISGDMAAADIGR